ncbi:MAG: hypothetical protein NC127_01490 [Muribaculum sp.]|nr:hypothetical protein [Muribaculum sp.]
MAPLDNESKSNLHKRAEIFPVLEYLMKGMRLNMPDDGLLSYEVTFAKASEGKDAPTVVMAFVPVFADGEWHIVVKQRY